MAAKKKAKASAKKKPAAKKAAAPKAAARKPIVARPIRQRLTKSALLAQITEQTGLARKDVAYVLESLEAALLGSVMKSSAGEFVLPGLFKVSLRNIPARKAGTLIRNPATGEMMKAAAKPASVRVKVRALAKLKAAATK